MNTVHEKLLILIHIETHYIPLRLVSKYYGRTPLYNDYFGVEEILDWAGRLATAR